MENTHPFVVRAAGRLWAFCHNGSVNDVHSLRSPQGIAPRGGTDSERLFHHVLVHFDENDVEDSVRAAFRNVRDYTALHSFLIQQDRIYAIAWRHPERSEPLYHALFEGWGTTCTWSFLRTGRRARRGEVRTASRIRGSCGLNGSGT